MAHLFIKRRTRGQDMFRSYEVLVDGVVCGKLRNRDFFDVKVPEGPRCVALRIDGLTSNHLCYFASSSVPAVFECMANVGRWGKNGKPSANRPWMYIKQINAEDVIRAFMKGLAGTLLRRQSTDSQQPILLDDFSYSHGDLSILMSSAGQDSGMLMTKEGSWNDRLWRHMVSVGWLLRSNEVVGLDGFTVYEFTSLGRVEVLDLLID